MTLPRALWIGCLLGVQTLTARAQQPSAAPVPGLHAVGFAHLVLEPTAASPRRVTLGAWFPRASRDSETVRYGELWDLARRQDPEVRATEGRDVVALQLAISGDSAPLFPLLDATLRRQTTALHGGNVAPGRHPLVLWGVRHGTIAAQATMSEFLASHGFVVITTWSDDSPLAMLWSPQPDSVKRATIEAHAGDLARAREYAARRLGADTSRTTLLAWSYGGQSAALLSRRVAVRGIISLDANVIGPSGIEVTPRPGPLLWMIGRDTARRAWSRRDSLPGDVLVLQVPSIAHGNFNEVEGYLPGLLGMPRVQRWSTSGTSAVDGYHALMRIVLAAALRWSATEVRESAWRGTVESAAAPVPIRIVRP